MIFRILIVCSMLLFAGSSYAANESFRFGFMPVYSMYYLHDPDGPTVAKGNITPVSAVGIYDWGRDARIFAHVYYADFTLPASSTNIGQNVKQYGFDGSYQIMWRLTRNFRPWFGLGLGFANETYTTRHTVVSGYVPPGGSYPDRTVENFYGVLNASNQWRLSRFWDMGVHLQLEKPTGDGARVIRAGIYFVF